nr:single-stranded DNA-binding protein [uncultured Olsenella sp.]
MSINKVVISGNLGRDPELRATRGGSQVCSFSVCVNTRQKQGDEWVDKANWVDVTFFGNRAERLGEYLSKGSHVTVAGRLSQSTWERNGQRRSKLEVIGEDIDFTGGQRQQGASQQGGSEDAYDEDIPF